MGWLRKTGNFLTFGALDRKEAKSITRDANAKQDEIKEELEISKENTQTELQRLGDLKSEVYSTTLEDFITSYHHIADVDLTPLKNVSEMNFEKHQFEMKELNVVSTNLKEAALIGGGLAVTGAVAAYGAMGLASVVGTAATGTAIGTLSGAAATNATLAWLGGGALSAGGAGMTGGMVVLGGIALAPVAVVGMFLGVNNGKQKLNDAKDYSAQVDVLTEKIKTLIMELSQVRRGCHLVSETIKGLNGVLVIQTSKMNEVTARLDRRSFVSKNVIDPIKTKVFKMSLYTDEEAQILCDSVNCASLLKQVMDMPLMNEDGAFMSEVFNFFEEQKPQIDDMIAKVQNNSTESTFIQEEQLLKAS